MSPECYPNDTDVIKHTTRRFSDQTAGNSLHKNDDTTVMMGIAGSRNGQCMLQMVADWQAVTIGTVDWIGKIHVGPRGHCHSRQKDRPCADRLSFDYTPFSSRHTSSYTSSRLLARDIWLSWGVLAFCSLLCPRLASNVLDDFGQQICICTRLGYCFELGVLREIDSEGFRGKQYPEACGAGRTHQGGSVLSVLTGADQIITNAYLTQWHDFQWVV